MIPRSRTREKNRPERLLHDIRKRVAIIGLHTPENVSSILWSAVSGAIPPLPNTPSWRGAELKKHRDNFTFTSMV